MHHEKTDYHKKPYPSNLKEEKPEKSISSQIYGALFSFVNRLDWMRAEELAIAKNQLPVLLQILVKSRKSDIAASIFYRQKMKMADVGGNKKVRTEI